MPARYTADTGTTARCAKETSGMCSVSLNQKLWGQPMLFAGEIHALHVPWPEGIDRANIPTCPDTSLPWSGDFALGGWSARMFVHQMLSTLLPGWRCSDTESLLSRSTLVISQVRVAGGSSVSDALLPCVPDSSDLYLTPQMVMGLLHRAAKRKRPLQRVLLRTQTGWLRKTLTVTNRDGAYECSIRPNANPCRGSPEAGLLDYLARAVASCSVTR